MEGGMGAVSFLPVVAGKQEGDPERAQPSVLCIRLLVVADGPHELLDGHGLLVLVQVALGGQTGWREGEGGGGVEDHEGCGSSKACLDTFRAMRVGQRARKEFHRNSRTRARINLESIKDSPAPECFLSFPLGFPHLGLSEC